MAYFVVTQEHGPAWEHARDLREQAGWDAHASFMDRLVADGFVVLGGPLGPDENAGETVFWWCGTTAPMPSMRGSRQTHGGKRESSVSRT